MSTNATIIRKVEEDKYEAIYLHWDGYPSEVMKNLPIPLSWSKGCSLKATAPSSHQMLTIAHSTVVTVRRLMLMLKPLPQYEKLKTSTATATTTCGILLLSQPATKATGELCNGLH